MSRSATRIASSCRGTATVRWGLSVPSTAYELVKQVAANPPILHDGDTIQLRPPAGADEQRAMTVAYEVTVPRGTVVRTSSDSGATTVSGVDGRVSIHTQSAAIAVRDLGGETDVTTGSGEVQADGINGDLSVATQSSRIPVRDLAGGLRVRTQSGAVEGSLRGRGDVNIGTGSSAIDLIGVNGALIATSSSGRIRVSGASGRAMAGDERFGQLRSGLRFELQAHPRRTERLRLSVRRRLDASGSSRKGPRRARSAAAARSCGPAAAVDRFGSACDDEDTGCHFASVVNAK